MSEQAWPTFLNTLAPDSRVRHEKWVQDWEQFRESKAHLADQSYATLLLTYFTACLDDGCSASSPSLMSACAYSISNHTSKFNIKMDSKSTSNPLFLKFSPSSIPSTSMSIWVHHQTVCWICLRPILVLSWVRKNEEMKNDGIKALILQFSFNFPSIFF